MGEYNTSERKTSIIELLKSSGILICANIILKSIQFFLMPIYTKYLDPAEIGISDIITTTTSVILPLLTLALDSSFSAFYYDKLDNNKEKVFNTILSILMIQSLIPVALCPFAGQISEIIFGTREYSVGIILALIAMSLNLLFIPHSVRLRMENRMYIFAFINISASITMIVSNIIFVAILKTGYTALIISQVVTNVVQLLMYVAIPRYIYKFKYVSKEYIHKLIKYGLPIVPTSIFSWILSSSDRYMILYMCGEDQVGLYSIGARFLALLNVVVNAINTAYTTFAFKNKDSQNAKEMYSNVFTLISFLLLGICFTIAMFSRQFVELMADQKYHSAYTLVGPLMFSQAMMAFSNLVAYGISFMKKSRYFLYSTLTAGVLNIILNYFLVKEKQAYGAAIATMLAHVVLFYIMYIVAQRLYPCEYNVKKTMIVFLITVCISLICSQWELKMQILVYIITVIICIILYYKDIRRIVTSFKY